MALVGVVAAAKLAGKDRSTIRRAMDAGTLTHTRGNRGQRVVDVAELERVYGALHPPTVEAPAPDHEGATQPDAPYTSGGPTYRPTNGGDPVLRALNRARDRVQVWLGVSG